MDVWLCWLWIGHFYVASCDVAPLSFGRGEVGGGLEVGFLIVLVV